MKTYDIINAGPNNRFMANGRVVSNSGRNLQIHNLPQNHIDALEEARSLVKMGCFETVELLYGNTPDVLSQLIRTMLIPKEGCEFIVADFSAIEARVLAWEAGESWRLKAFRRGEDIYCASASQMFGVPVVKHGINGDLRQKGKVAELACIAEGSLVLTDRGLVPIENVTTKHLLWDGEEWVHHEGVVYRGEKEVLTYGGLTATADHPVWIEGQAWPVCFGIAAACGAHLAQTGDGRKAVRLGENYLRRKKVAERQSMLCPNSMPRMPYHSMAVSIEPSIREVKGMSELFTAAANPQMAGQEADSSKTAMRESEGCRIPQLRCEGYQIRLSYSYRGRALSHQRVRFTQEGNGNRQDRQQWQLRTGQSEICFTPKKSAEQTVNRFVKVRSGVLALCQKCGYSETEPGDDQRRSYSRRRESCVREAEELEVHSRKVRVYDIRNAGRRHRFTVSGCLVHNCGYGGSSGALISMGALDMGLKEAELPDLIRDWREANPKIVQYWWDVEKAAIHTVQTHEESEIRHIGFEYRAGTLFMKLPSGRKLAYLKPRLQPNRFGRMSITFEGVGANNKWVRQETYSGKLVENCIAQGTEVLTDRGLVAIEQVTEEDRLWDGEEWVSHEGLLRKGEQTTIMAGGVRMTPDHKILTTQGWRKCCEADGLIWAEVSPPDSDSFPGTRTPEQISIGRTELQEQVYDIRNCGSRHRFCVFDRSAGKLRVVSNCTQAIARDILAEAMLRMEREGLAIVGSVHDEVIIEAPIGKYTVNEVCQLMSQNPEWCRDLPLAAAGYTGKFYFKD